jgi:hypothetical protein
MSILDIVLIALFSPLTLMLLFSPFYINFGLNKWLYHDIMGWHQPKEDANTTFDGCSFKCICKHCGKEIMQDSQGNWFESEDI